MADAVYLLLIVPNAMHDDAPCNKPDFASMTALSSLYPSPQSCNVIPYTQE